MLKLIEKNKNLLKMPKSWVTFYFVVPLAILLVKGLVKTKIKPNSVTFFSGFLALIAGFFFWQGTWPYLALGALFFYFSATLDHVDGSLARLTNQETKLGSKIDGLMDSMRKIICFLPLLYSQFYIKGGVKLLILGIGLIFLHYGMHFVYNLLKYRKFQPTEFCQRHLDLAKGISPHPFCKAEEQFLIFIVGPLLNQFVIVFCIGLGLFFLLGVLVKIKIALFGGKGW